MNKTDRFILSVMILCSLVTIVTLTAMAIDLFKFPLFILIIGITIGSIMIIFMIISIINQYWELAALFEE